MKMLNFKKAFCRLGRKLFAFLCPRACPFCLRSLIKENHSGKCRVCKSCLNAIQALVLENSFAYLPERHLVISLYPYEKYLAQAIRQLKFHDALEFCPALNDLFWVDFSKKIASLKELCFYLDEKDQVYAFRPQSEEFFNFKYRKFLRQTENFFYQKTFQKIIFIPLPLHFKRQHQRGYNQVTEFLKVSEEQIKRYGYLDEKLLVRSRASQRQTEMKDKEARRLNVQKIFSCKDYLYRSKEKEEYLLVVVDDVKTTGATLASAMACLKEAGFIHVIAVALCTEF